MDGRKGKKHMTLALLLLVATGLSWVSVGAAVGHVERRGWSLVRYQILLCLVCVALGLVGWAMAPDAFLPRSGCPTLTWVLVIAGMLSSGVFNYLMVLAMGSAMKRGPNAIVWAIVQSGLIYPFLMGWLVFDVPMGPRRLCGIALIVASVYLYATRHAEGAEAEARQKSHAENAEGAEKQSHAESAKFAEAPARQKSHAESAEAAARAGKDEPSALRQWLPAALLGMLFCGINQCGANLPSYLEGGQDFSGTFRTFALYFGLLMSALVHLAGQRLRGTRLASAAPGELRGLALWAVGVGTMSFLTSRYLAFPGLDTLKRLGAGSMGYPVMVASCIVGFFPYGVFVLRERINARQALGAVLGLVGILVGCL